MSSHRAATPKTAATDCPPDIDTMRVSAHHALIGKPHGDELETLRDQLRGHIALLIPEVEQLAAKEPKDSVPRYCALACVGEAHAKLRMGDGSPYPDVRLAAVEKLARVTNALCDHFVNLGGRS